MGSTKCLTSDQDGFTTHSCTESEVDNAPEEKPKSVRFSTVEIREYSRTLGDNPSVTCGPPITISWKYDPDVLRYDVASYEESKPPPRESSQMLVPRATREAWLMDAGFARGEIANVVRDVDVAKSKRAQSAKRSGMHKLADAAESLRRKLGRAILRREHDSALYRRWSKDREEWERARKPAPRSMSAPPTLRSLRLDAVSVSKSETRRFSAPGELFLGRERRLSGPSLWSCRSDTDESKDLHTPEIFSPAEKKNPRLNDTKISETKAEASFCSNSVQASDESSNETCISGISDALDNTNALHPIINCQAREKAVTSCKNYHDVSSVSD